MFSGIPCAEPASRTEVFCSDGRLRLGAHQSESLDDDFSVLDLDLFTARQANVTIGRVDDAWARTLNGGAARRA